MKTIISSILIIFLGGISHFFYKWSHNNKYIGLFTSVNESTWEHIKLALFPTFIFIIIELFVIKNINVMFAGLVALTLEIILIPLLFYTTKIFIKKDVVWGDICIFIIAIIISIYTFYKLLPLEISPVINILSAIGIIFIFWMYISFTTYPPHIFLFKDPITNKYGYIK